MPGSHATEADFLSRMELNLSVTQPVAVGVGLTGTAYYGDHLLFENLSFDLAASKWTCLLGPSGVGKSTLLQLLAGLAPEVRFVGRIEASNGEVLASQISYMAQSDLLFPWLDIQQNVMLGQRLRAESLDSDKASQLIEQVGLEAHTHKRPHQLSGGMRQRVALARTLMEDTPVVLLDEPFSALDARTRAEMQDLAFEVLKHKTVLLVTHDPAEAVRLSHHLYLMSSTGIENRSASDSEPVRAIDDSATLKAQATLLMALKRME